MVENSRKDPRAKVLSMTVRYKSATLDEFIEHHSHDVSRGGMYIKTPQPFPPGTLLKFEVKIGSDQKVIQGVGRVVWRRQSDEATESHPAGMGVKFIKLDEESKAIISQVVIARGDETSAYDEVAANSERPPVNASEPPAQTTGSAGFFPASNEDVPAPAAEDRTVMKQAAELLQEALREVTSTGDSEPPTGKPDAISSLKQTRSATTTPAPGGQAGLSGRSMGPAHSSAKDASNVVSTVPPAEAARISRSGKPADVSQPPRASGRAAPRTAQAPIRAAAQPRAQSLSAGANRRDSGEDAESEAVRSTAAAPIPIEQVPPPRKSGGGGVRAIIMLLLVGGVAAAVFVLTRKSPPPPPPPIEPAPMATVSAAELAVSASPTESASAEPSALAAASASASVEPSTAPAAASAAPATSAAPANQLEPPATAAAEPKPKPVVRPRVTPRKKPAAGTDTATGEQPTTPPESAPPKPAETETPKAPVDTPTTGAETTTGAAKASPKVEAPAPPQSSSQL